MSLHTGTRLAGFQKMKVEMHPSSEPLIKNTAGLFRLASWNIITAGEVML